MDPVASVSDDGAGGEEPQRRAGLPCDGATKRHEGEKRVKRSTTKHEDNPEALLLLPTASDSFV